MYFVNFQHTLLLSSDQWNV